MNKKLENRKKIQEEVGDFSITFECDLQLRRQPGNFQENFHLICKKLLFLL